MGGAGSPSAQWWYEPIGSPTEIAKLPTFAQTAKVLDKSTDPINSNLEYTWRPGYPNQLIRFDMITVNIPVDQFGRPATQFLKLTIQEVDIGPTPSVVVFRSTTSWDALFPENGHVYSQSGLVGFIPIQFIDVEVKIYPLARCNDCTDS